MSGIQQIFLTTLDSLAAKPGRAVKASDVHDVLDEIDARTAEAARSGLTRELLDEGLIELSWDRPPVGGASPIAFYRLTDQGQEVVQALAKAEEVVIAQPGARSRPSALAERLLVYA